MSNMIEPNIQKLIDLTTIVKVYDNFSRKIIFGDEYNFSKFVEKREKQVDISIFENNWRNKWQSFGNKWNKERQNYRFFYDSFRLFYFSFEQLHFNKIACINEAYGDQQKMLHFNELTGVNLYGMYHHGKKCIDLLKELKIFDELIDDRNFLEKFSETRNKLIEHNYNPSGLTLLIEPSIWSLSGTHSFLEVLLHKLDTERAFDAYVDYYEDYFYLEKIINNVIKGF